MELASFVEKVEGRFEEAMDDDFNTAQAIGHLFELVREVNKFLDAKPHAETSKDAVRTAVKAMGRMGAVLNLFKRTPEAWNRDLLVSKKIPLTPAKIEEKIAERKAARDGKEWARADTIRTELEGAGIILEDKRERTSWKVKIE
jgi:cysteinyl-tRNA synthetase